MSPLIVCWGFFTSMIWNALLNGFISIIAFLYMVGHLSLLGDSKKSCQYAVSFCCVVLMMLNVFLKLGMERIFQYTGIVSESSCNILMMLNVFLKLDIFFGLFLSPYDNWFANMLYLYHSAILSSWCKNVILKFLMASISFLWLGIWVYWGLNNTNGNHCWWSILWWWYITRIILKDLWKSVIFLSNVF